MAISTVDTEEELYHSIEAMRAEDLGEVREILEARRLGATSSPRDPTGAFSA